jgi:hypothetical protein
MSRFLVPTVTLLLVSTALAATDVSKTFELLAKGKTLTAADAQKLETRLEKKPTDEEARIELLSYYAARPAGVDLQGGKAARARHILWVIENDPASGMGLFQVSTGVYRLNCRGDELADADAAKQAIELWARMLQQHPTPEVRRNAVDAMQYCSPEQAAQILVAANDQAGLGRLYAHAALGITGLSYQGSDPANSDAALRATPFAETARRALEDATDKDMLTAAAVTLLRDGAILWADGHLDWDYTPLGNALLTKAKAAAPNNMTLLTAPTSLPARGERPPLTIRVGGNVQQAKMLRSVAPRYPPDARSLGIQGTVKLTVLIGLDGSVLFLQPIGGPPELIPASIEAVRQWQYKPSLLNGKPCYIVTQIDVNYTLSPR